MSARTFSVTTYKCDNCGHQTFRRNLPVVDCPSGWGVHRQDEYQWPSGVMVSAHPATHFCPACVVALGPGHLTTTRDGRTPEEQVAHATIVLQLGDRKRHGMEHAVAHHVETARYAL